MNAQYMNMNNCGMFNVSLWKWNGDNFIHFAPCCSLFQQKFIADISQSNQVISVMMTSSVRSSTRNMCSDWAGLEDILYIL